MASFPLTLLKLILMHQHRLLSIKSLSCVSEGLQPQAKSALTFLATMIENNRVDGCMQISKALHADFEGPADRGPKAEAA